MHVADLWQAQDIVAPGRHSLLPEAADVPDPHSLVQRRRHHQVIFWMEAG